jgi:hypothetical protein
MVVFALVMPSIRPQGPRRPLDSLGMSVLVMAVVPLMLAFSWGGTQYDWLSPQIIGLLVLAFVAAGALVRIEGGAAEPIIPLSLFRSSIFVVIIGVTFLTAMGMFGSVSYIPLFVQSVIGTSATNSGLVTMPMMLTMSVVSAGVGQLLSRTGRYRILLVAGLAVTTLGMYMLARMDVDSNQGEATRDMIVMGIGLGAAMPILMLVALNTASHEMLGVTTSTIQFMRSVGATLGVALMGSLLNGRLQSELVSQTPAQVTQNVPAPLLQRLQDPQILVVSDAMKTIHEAFLGLGDQGQQLYDQALLATKTALAMGITHAFLIGAGITLVSLVLGIFLKEVPLRKTYAIPVEGAPPPDGSGGQAPREAIAPAPPVTGDSPSAPDPALAADPPSLQGSDGRGGASAGPAHPAEP